MKQTLIKTIMIGAFMLNLAGLQAAPQHERDDEGWNKTRDSFYQTEGWRARMFERVREDINRVQTVAFTSGDEYRLARTRDELTDLQSKMAAGKYDEPELDSVIGA